MKKIRIFLTFDYELPLGGIKKDYAHSLFKPTEELFEVVKRLDVPITFFADILSYIKFKEWDIIEYYQNFEKQLQSALSKRHDVQLHIHPHWIDTTLENNIFIPDTKFGLGEFSNQDYPNNIEGIVEKSYQSLTKICQKKDSTHKVIAYRAGGYNLFPETDRILNALYDNGIRVDSSIGRGYYFKSDYSEIDYRNVPNKPNWHLDLNGDFSKESENSIYEIPLGTKPKSIFEVPTKFKLKKYAFRAVENRGKMIHINEKVQLKDKIKQALSARMLSVDNHTYSSDFLIKILKYNVNKFKKFDSIDLSLIGHPKSMGDYSFKLLEEFVKKSRDLYKEKIEFTTFKSSF